MTRYTDFDYDSLPVPDFSSGRHWVLLTDAELEKRREARRRAYEEELQANHPDHRVVLVKSKPTDSPTQEHMWPLINDAINAVLEEDHPAAFDQICELVDDIVASHRGWRNPRPVSLDTPRHLTHFARNLKNHQPEK